MDFGTFLQTVLTSATTSGIVALVLGSLWKQALDRDLVSYRHRLEHDAFEQRTRFSWAHQKQSEVIAEVYGKLADTHRKMKEFIAPGQFNAADKASKRAPAVDAYLDLQEFFTSKRVFLSEAVGDQVEELIMMLLRTFNVIEGTNLPGNSEEHLKAQQEGWERVNTEAPTVLAALRREFRGTLAITE